MKILVTGAAGMLGQEIVSTFRAAGHKVFATDRDTLDITNATETRAIIMHEAPDVVVNTAAYNFVDKVEENEMFGLAYAINAEGPRNLAIACRERGIPFVHYSTDYVFAGDRPEGYSELDPVSPISKYGQTKAAGERLVREVGGDYYICRLSKIFGQPGASTGSKESFVALMLRLAKDKPHLNIVHEEVGSPSYCPDIAKATLSIIENRISAGIYHMVNEGAGVTWFEFAEEIFTLAGITVSRSPVLSSEFPKPAARPKFAALKNTKLIKLRDRKEALREFIATLS